MANTTDPALKNIAPPKISSPKLTNFAQGKSISPIKFAVPSTTFKPLKNLSTSASSLKLSNLAQPKTTSTKITLPKTPKDTTQKPFDYSKITKITNLPKTPKMTILKTAIKKVKNGGF